jgi:predicted membrane protein
LEDNLVSRIHGIFNNERLRSVLTKLRFPIFVIFFIVLIPRIKPSLFLPGLLVTLFGTVIQSWSFASLNKNTTLAIQGPYVLTRNPMYIGLLLTGNILVIFIFTLLYYFYMVNRVKREERQLHILFKEAYENYCRKVNRFLPSFKLIGHRRLWVFRWNLFLKNHGPLNVMTVLSCYAMFYLFTFTFNSSL